MPGHIRRINLHPRQFDGGASSFFLGMNDETFGPAYRNVKSCSITRVWQGMGAVEMSLGQDNEQATDLAKVLLSGSDQVINYTVVTDVDAPDGEQKRILPSGMGVIQKVNGDEVSIPYGQWGFSGKDDYFGAAEWSTEDAHTFTNATVGNILEFYAADAGANMPALPDLAQDEFTWDKDANGNVWTKTISMIVGPGVKFLEILESLYEFQLASFRVLAGHAFVYDWGSLPADEDEPVHVFTDRFLDESPLSVDNSDRAGRVVIRGSDTPEAPWSGKQIVDLDDLLTTFPARTITRYESQGNFTRQSQVTLYVDSHRGSWTKVNFQKTFKYQANAEEAVPLPFTDYNVGDFIRLRQTKSILASAVLRVVQISVSQDEDGKVWVTVVLNSFLDEAQDKIVSAVNGITGGTTVTGRTTARLI